MWEACPTPFLFSSWFSLSTDAVTGTTAEWSGAWTLTEHTCVRTPALLLTGFGSEQITDFSASVFSPVKWG